MRQPFLRCGSGALWSVSTLAAGTNFSPFLTGGFGASGFSSGGFRRAETSFSPAALRFLGDGASGAIGEAGGGAGLAWRFCLTGRGGEGGLAVETLPASSPAGALGGVELFTGFEAAEGVARNVFAGAAGTAGGVARNVFAGAVGAVGGLENEGCLNEAATINGSAGALSSAAISMMKGSDASFPSGKSSASPPSGNSDSGKRAGSVRFSSSRSFSTRKSSNFRLRSNNCTYNTSSVCRAFSSGVGRRNIFLHH